MGSLVASSFAAPVAEADADAQVLLGHHGLVGGVYASAPAATVALNAAPVAAYHAVATPAVHVAAPAVAEVKTVEVKAAPAVVPAATYAYAAPIAHHVVAAAPAEVKTVEVKAAPAVAAAVVPAAYHAVAAPAVHVATAPVVSMLATKSTTKFTMSLRFMFRSTLALTPPPMLSTMPLLLVPSLVELPLLKMLLRMPLLLKKPNKFRTNLSILEKQRRSSKSVSLR